MNQQVADVHRFEAIPCNCRQCGRSFNGQTGTIFHGRDTGTTRMVDGRHVETRTIQLCTVCAALAPYRDTPKVRFRSDLVHRDVIEAMADGLRKKGDAATKVEAAHADRLLESCESATWVLWDRVVSHPSAQALGAYLPQIEASLLGVNPRAQLQLGPIATNAGAVRGVGQNWMFGAVDMLENLQFGVVEPETEAANRQALETKDGLVKAVIRGRVDPSNNRAPTCRAGVPQSLEQKRTLSVASFVTRSPPWG